MQSIINSLSKKMIPTFVKYHLKCFYIFTFRREAGYSPEFLPKSPGQALPNKELDCSIYKAEVDKAPFYNYKIQSENLKLLYYEIPKNASSSLKTTLFSLEHKMKYDSAYSMFMDYRRWQKTFPTMVVTWDSLISSDFFKFMFLRNPWERLLSGYLNTGWSFHFKNVTFEQFIESLTERIATPASDILNNHYKPLSYFVPVSGSSYFVDFVGKVENFHEDFSTILSACKLKLDTSLILRKNNSKHADYQSYYTSRTRKIIENIYGDEIELGKYTFAGETTN